MGTYLLPIGPVAVFTAPTLATPLSDWEKVGYSVGDAAIRPNFSKAYRRNDHVGSTPVAGGTYVTGHDGQVEMRIAAETLEALAAVVQGFRVSGTRVGLQSGPSRVEERAWALVPISEINEEGNWLASESAVILPLAGAEVTDLTPGRGVPEGEGNQEGYALRLAAVTGGNAPMLVGHAWAHGIASYGIKAVLDFSQRTVVVHPNRATNFVRAGVAWSKHPDTGAWTQAAANVPRFVKAADGRIGILLEGQRTNYVLRNHTAAGLAAGCTLSGAGAANAVLSFPNDAAPLAAAGLSALVPDGIVARVTNNDPANPCILAFAGTGSLTAVASSVFVRTGSSVGESSVGWARYGTRKVVGNTYKRLEAYHTNVTPIAGTVYVEVPPNTSVWAVLAQAEQGYNATTPIQTTGAAASRVNEQLVMPFTDLLDDTFTFGVDFERIEPEQTIIPISTTAFYGLGMKHVRFNDVKLQPTLVATRDENATSNLVATLAAYQAARRLVAQIEPAAWRLYVNTELKATASPPPQSLPTGQVAGLEFAFPHVTYALGGFILKGFFVAEGLIDPADADRVLGNLLSV